MRGTPKLLAAPRRRRTRCSSATATSSSCATPATPTPTPRRRPTRRRRPSRPPGAAAAAAGGAGRGAAARAATSPSWRRRRGPSTRSRSTRASTTRRAAGARRGRSGGSALLKVAPRVAEVTEDRAKVLRWRQSPCGGPIRGCHDGVGRRVAGGARVLGLRAHRGGGERAERRADHRGARSPYEESITRPHHKQFTLTGGTAMWDARLQGRQ